MNQEESVMAITQKDYVAIARALHLRREGELLRIANVEGVINHVQAKVVYEAHNRYVMAVVEGIRASGVPSFKEATFMNTAGFNPNY